MLTATHTLIADTLRSFIGERTGVFLKKKHFRYGCIKPDLVPKLISVPHYFSESFAFVMEEAGRLYEMNFSKKKSFAKFCERLGVIVHYLSDFFCTAHNSPAYDNLGRHVTYEAYLAGLFEKMKNEGKPLSKNPHFSVPRDIQSFVLLSHERYLALPFTKENDYLFSLGVCAGVCIKIVEELILPLAENGAKAEAS